MRRRQLAGLWQHDAFMKLWIGSAISEFGSQITAFALPIMAVITLNATPMQMGMLRTAAVAPALLIGLFAGAWVDRMRRRPILIWADVGRAVLVGSIPVAASFHLLHIEYLYIVVFLTSILSIFFDIAYLSFLPSIVQREQLVEGNSKLSITSSIGQSVGPSMAGGLVQVMGASFVVIFDALSFLVSALFVQQIRSEEHRIEPTGRRNVWGEMREGIRLIVGNVFLRAIACYLATHFLFVSVHSTIFVVYLIREAHLTPTMIGIIFASLGIGSIIGAWGADRIAKRLGIGPAIIGAALLNGIALVMTALPNDHRFISVSLLILAFVLLGMGLTIMTVNQLSLRQAMTPDHLQGRMNASMRFLAWSTVPAGALLGGWLGEMLGLRTTLFVGGLGVLVGVAWLICSPLRKLDTLPLSTNDEQTAAA